MGNIQDYFKEKGEGKRKSESEVILCRCSSIDVNVSPIYVMLTKPTSKEEEEEVLQHHLLLVELVKVDFCETGAQSLKLFGIAFLASFLAPKMDKVEGACNGQFEYMRPLTLKEIQEAIVVDSIS